MYIRLHMTKPNALFATTVFFVVVAEVFPTLICMGTCRDQMNRSVSCSQENYTDFDIKLLSPTVKPCGPSDPVDFKGQVLYPTDHESAELKYTWKSPDDSSVDDLVGFQISVGFPERSTISHTRVFRIRLNNSSTHRGWSFQLLCTYNKPSVNVRVHATYTSLPLCKNKIPDYNLTVNILPKTSPALYSPTENGQGNDPPLTTLNIVLSTPTPALSIPRGNGQKGDQTLTIVAIVASVLTVMAITILVWFVRHKALTTQKLRILDNAREGRESKDSHSPSIRYQNNACEMRNIAASTQINLHDGYSNYGESREIDIQRRSLNEGMYSPMYSKVPCPIHGYNSSDVAGSLVDSNRYIPYTVSKVTDLGAFVQPKCNMTGAGDTLEMLQIFPDTDSQETVTPGDSPEGGYHPEMPGDYQSITIAGDSDEENGAYDSTNIEEKWLRLNEEVS